jgi:hypothetical protein
MNTLHKAKQIKATLYNINFVEITGSNQDLVQPTYCITVTHTYHLVRSSDAAYRMFNTVADTCDDGRQTYNA